MLKKILGAIAIIVLAGVGYGIYVWNKPARNVLDEKNYITVSAADIFNQYKADEAKANKMYLDSAIQVTGEVEKIEKIKMANRWYA